MLETLVRQNPRLVGFSTYLWSVEACLELARALKAARPDCAVLFGGPETGPRAEALLRDEPAVDFVIDGEGEAAFRDLCLCLTGGADVLDSVPGLVRRQVDGRPRRNPVRAVPVAELPDLATMGLAGDRDLVYWETSRGCPFRCSFCCSSEDALRPFPPERIERDLNLLGGLRDKTVKLLDRSFHLGRRRTTGLLRRLIATPAGLRFHLELNPDRISGEALALFAAAPAGKFQFEVGLQTLNPAVLQRIERAMDVPKALANLRRLIEIGRHPVHLDLIAGLPGEDLDSLRASLDASFALGPDHLQLGLLKLLPGTPLRRQAPALGYLWRREPPYPVTASDAMDGDDLARCRDWSELLERLWNSGWLGTTLPMLAEATGGRVSVLLDRIRAHPRGRVLRRRPPAPAAFESVCAVFAPELEADESLRRALLWDYARLQRPGRDTPAAIRGWWRVEQGCPVLELDRRLVARISRRLPVTAPGRYRVRLRHHLRGRPVTLERLGR